MRFRKRLEEIIDKRKDKGPILKFIRERPLLQKLFEDLKPEILDAEEFDIKLKEDINNVQSGEEVLIFSPFTYKENIDDILPYLKTAIKKGAKVTIQTLDPSYFAMINQKSKEEWQAKNIQKLMDTGIEVITRKNMHEKAVIIGERVAYLGSTNVLSKLEGKGDYMLRYTNPELVRVFYYFLAELAQASEMGE